MRLEHDHINKGLTFKELAQRYDVSESAITYQSKRRNWREKRQIKRKSIHGALVSTRNAIEKLTHKLDTLDPTSDEDIKEWDKTNAQIRTLALNVKRLEGNNDILGDVLGAMSSFREFLEPRCKDREFWEKLADYTEQWIMHIQKQ